MNIKDIVKELREMLEKVETAVNKLEPVVDDGYFEPEGGEDYFILTGEGEIIECIMTYISSYDYRYPLTGNSFRTREGAEKALARREATVRVYRKIKEWNVAHPSENKVAIRIKNGDSLVFDRFNINIIKELKINDTDSIHTDFLNFLGESFIKDYKLMLGYGD